MDREEGWNLPDGPHWTGEGPHEHAWGPVEHARMTGNPHRKCTVPGCRFVSLDLYDDDDDES